MSSEKNEASNPVPAAPRKEQKLLLEKVLHELNGTHGLLVTDRPEAYNDALQSGCDARKGLRPRRVNL